MYINYYRCDSTLNRKHKHPYFIEQPVIKACATKYITDFLNYDSNLFIMTLKQRMTCFVLFI